MHNWFAKTHARFQWKMAQSNIYRLRMRNSIFTNPILIVLGICGLVTIHDTVGGLREYWEATLFLGLVVIALIAGTIYAVILVRSSRA
jgi:hypothetical protein